MKTEIMVLSAMLALTISLHSFNPQNLTNVKSNNILIIDSDGDGIPDDKDECPYTPAGTIVDAHGCPIPENISIIDSDGDGVTDDRDKCPNTPRNTVVDADGCPIRA